MIRAFRAPGRQLHLQPRSAGDCKLQRRSNSTAATPFHFDIGRWRDSVEQSGNSRESRKN